LPKLAGFVILRLTFFLLAVLVAGVFGQGPTPVKAGDLAPGIVWTSILQPASSASGGPENLLGRVTVIFLFPNVSSNPSLDSRWNLLLAQFADKPVNFVWITSESAPELAQSLQVHPVNGWLLLDSNWDTARAYGMETPGAWAHAVIVDPNGRIAGFTFLEPDEAQIKAVLEGRAIAIDGDANDAQMNEILAGRAVRLDAGPHRSPAPAEPKPDIPPSYEVHISPTTTRGTSSSAGPDHSVQLGFDLRTMLSIVTEKDPTRIVLPASLEIPSSPENKARYDFVLVLPREEDKATKSRLVQQGIEKYFQVSITVENRTTDVYVMTALEGKTPAAKDPDEAHGGFSSSSFSKRVEIATKESGIPPTIDELREAGMSRGISEISASNCTMDDFRRSLEDGLERPIVDETNLTGRFDLAVHGKARNTEEFLQLLRDQLGLVLTPAQRRIEMLVVKPTR
jgi:uncharacterized protein (TIGR03435 family)